VRITGHHLRDHNDGQHDEGEALGGQYDDRYDQRARHG
jgi:hypothetical protein